MRFLALPSLFDQVWVFPLRALILLKHVLLSPFTLLNIIAFSFLRLFALSSSSRLDDFVPQAPAPFVGPALQISVVFSTPQSPSLPELGALFYGSK